MERSLPPKPSRHRLRAALPILLVFALWGCSTAPEEELPPVVYMCPMVKDADVLEDHPGKCPRCGMELKPVRIVSAWSCLNNTAFIQETPGKCRTNGTDLVPITASMFWACAQSPDKHELDPGKCADGSERIKKLEPRLHGDHNPRHGGQLFMADNGWHHLEGTYPSPELFRVFFYDDWTRPLTPDGFTGSVVLKDASGKELETIPLQAGSIANAMEGRIRKGSLPLNASLRVRFKTTEPEKLFDFTFREYSKDPGASTGVTPPAAPLPAATAAAPTTETPGETPAPAADTPGGVPVDAVTAALFFQPAPIPGTARGILDELNTRSRELADKVQLGAPLGEYWYPALRAKDLALALVSDHIREIPSRQRGAAENAADRLLRAAYAIDNFGDLGDRERALSAHDAFVQAVNDLKSAYASIR